MSTTVRPRPPLFPVKALVVVGLMIAAALAAVVMAKVGVIERRAAPVAEPVMVRELRFDDRPDGGIVVREWPSEGVVTVLEPGAGDGFVRGVVRGIARTRKLMGVGADEPFRLTAWDDGRLTFADPASGEVVEIAGPFGATNTASFMALLTAEVQAP
ncbi:MAG: photosynthetic complex assembly protein PuhC [Pseudomonadota bacterium]